MVFQYRGLGLLVFTGGAMILSLNDQKPWWKTDHLGQSPFAVLERCGSELFGLAYTVPPPQLHGRGAFYCLRGGTFSPSCRL